MAEWSLVPTEDLSNLAITTTYGWDKDDLLVLLLDADGFETTTQYDGKGRATRVDYETGLFEAWSYDQADRLLTHRTQDAVVTVFEYFDDTLLARMAGGLREEFSWNALNQMLSAESFAAGQLRNSVAFEYDGFSRLESEDQDGLEVSFDYDASHNMMALDYPGTGPSLTQASTRSSGSNRSPTAACSPPSMRPSMTDEQKVRELFEACRNLIDDDGAKQVSHYVEHNEHEMALEGLILELIAADAAPKNFEFSEWEELARRMGLGEEAVFDGDFWSKFSAWGKTRG